MSSLSSRKIILKSSNDVAYEVDVTVARVSQTIRFLIEDDCTESGIPLANVTSKILSKVIEYCKKHLENPKPEAPAGAYSDDDLYAFDTDFVNVDQATV